MLRLMALAVTVLFLLLLHSPPFRRFALPIVMKKEEWDKDKSEYVTRDEDETVNKANALWARPKADVTQDQYDEFYKHVSHDFE